MGYSPNETRDGDGDADAPAPKSRKRRVSRMSAEDPEGLPWDRLNAILHQYFVRGDLDVCEDLVQLGLEQTKDMNVFYFRIKGMMHRNKGEVAESLPHFHTAATLAPMNIEYMKQVARSLLLLGKHSAALDMYRDANGRCTQADWEILHNMGMCHIYTDEVDDAEKMFRKALEAKQQDVTFKQLGRLYFLKGDLEGALDIFTAASKCYPENIDFLRALGMMHYQANDMMKAFTFFGKALTLNPSDPDVLTAAASIIQRNTEHEIALTKYRVPILTNPHSPQLWNNIGLCFLSQGINMTAILCLRRAVYHGPFEWKIHLNLGLANMQSKRFASAFHHLSACLNLHPDFGLAYELLGITLAHLHDFENSFLAFDKALAGSSTRGGILHLNYALALHWSGDHAAAALKQLALFREYAAMADDADSENYFETKTADRLEKQLKSLR